MENVFPEDSTTLYVSAVTSVQNGINGDTLLGENNTFSNLEVIIHLSCAASILVNEGRCRGCFVQSASQLLWKGLAKWTTGGGTIEGRRVVVVEELY